MDRKKIVLSLASLFLIGSVEGNAQSGLKKSNKEYDRWAYIESAKIYEKVLKRGYSSQDLLEKLGNSYYFNALYAEANKYYGQLFAEYGSEGISEEYYYRYAQTLEHIGENALSKKYYDIFVQKVGSEKQVAKFRASERELRDQIKANSNRYQGLENLSINTPYADYGSYVYDNQLYFTSARDTGSLSKKVHTWTDATFTSLYRHDLETRNDNKPAVKRIKGEVKSILNESTGVITKDGQTMYFTRNNIIDGVRKYDGEKSTLLKIYRAKLVDGQWKEVEELPFNSNEFNTAHPALSNDEKLLYFASDRPGGYGGSDLWRVSIHDNGTFGGPENLGPAINTEFRDTFPFITSNDELYFSTDGRVGLGGLDVFGVKTYADGSFGEVQNLGAPINTNADDFAYYIDYQTKQGFVSSNREGGKGNDDIYSFLEVRPLQLDCLQNLTVVVVDRNTKEEIKDASLTLYDLVYNVEKRGATYNYGAYRFEKDFGCKESYRVKAEKAGYNAAETVAYLPAKSGETKVVIELEPVKIPFKEGDDLFKVLNLNPIYFDLDKHFIRPDAALELAKVLAVMEEYPTMVIDIRSHTDSRASFKYNERLSDRRAKSTREWLISKGIAPSRLTAKGYGEYELTNRCSDGVPCTEEEHQANRRSEFIIISM